MILSIKEFAKFYNIPISSVKSWVKHGKITVERSSTNRISIETEQLLPEVKMCPKDSKPKHRFNCETCNTEFFREDWQIKRDGKEKQKFCSLFCRRQNEESRKKLSEALKGRKVWNKGLSKLTDPRLNYIRPTLFKDEGKSTKNMLIRKSTEYRFWRTQVFERDDYTCQICKQKGGKLQADHIKPFCLFENLRFNVNNGRTLCKLCHTQTDTYGTKALNYQTI
jgi:hypothetical protein